MIQNSIIVTGNINIPGIHLINNKSDFEALLNFVQYSGGEITLSPDQKMLKIKKQRIYLSGETDFPVEVKFSEGLKASTLFTNSNIINENTYPFLLF